MNHKHVTDDCIHLKDVIEILIRDGHLKQYKKKESVKEETPSSSKVEEEKPTEESFMPIAMSISRPEDFIFPDLDTTLAYFAAHIP